MSPETTEKSSAHDPARMKKDRAAEVADTFEWLITAFILAFVFRAFVMEAFRIPTGSMADTLKGAHFRLACEQCGYKSEHGFTPRDYDLPEDTVPTSSVPLPITRCPSCGRYPSSLVCRRCGSPYDFRTLAEPNRSRRSTYAEGNADVLPSRCPKCRGELTSSKAVPVANGDRILVLKCIYQFSEPKRWDVIVFKNPTEPNINYIKRLIGLPSEKVHIIDGDIYINGQIARKPAKVQNELWMPVYDNDYQPARPGEGLFNGHAWQRPFRNTPGSGWVTADTSPTIFQLDSPAGEINSLVYDTSIGNDFRATYAYDDVDGYSDMPYCSDLMVRFDCVPAGPAGCVGIALSKYETTYRAEVAWPAGTMVVTMCENGKEPVELAKLPIERPETNKSTQVKFACVDHQLIFECGGAKWTHDLGRGAEDAGPIREDIEPQVEIFASGKLALSHTGLFRDIHYTKVRSPGRAVVEPFELEKDQFFVLGDNSPNSEDCRWWNQPGMANPGLSEYRTGVVPRDYLVGKALFVYWPSGFKPFEQFRFGIIPDIGRMRFIYGGSPEGVPRTNGN
ncbi:MAG: signal peptidase I [Planctomycetota bacterium]